MWISVATPVTKRMNAIESGSARKPNSTLRPPAGNQVKRSTTCCRCSGGRSRSAKNMTTDTRNARPSMALANQPASGSPMRLPNSSRKRAPKSGSAGTSQSRSRTSWELIRASALQHPHVVGGGPTPSAEDRHDDGEAHGDLGGGDHQGEEHERLPAHVVELPGEGHEREVHRVQHQLDAHEHHEHVAADQHADRTDGEYHRGQHEVVGVGDRHGAATSPSSVSTSSTSSTSSSTISPGGPLRRASTTLHTPAIRGRPAVISNGQRKSVNRTRATRSTLLPSAVPPPLSANWSGAMAPVAQLWPPRKISSASTMMPTAIAAMRWWGNGSSSDSSRSTPSSMITKRKSTTIAPA